MILKIESWEIGPCCIFPLILFLGLELYLYNCSNFESCKNMFLYIILETDLSFHGTTKSSSWKGS